MGLNKVKIDNRKTLLLKNRKLEDVIEELKAINKDYPNSCVEDFENSYGNLYVQIKYTIEREGLQIDNPSEYEIQEPLKKEVEKAKKDLEELEQNEESMEALAWIANQAQKDGMYDV